MELPPHKTKIVATIGPATSSKKMIEKLIEAGMSVARLNFSHGTFEEHEKMIEIIREVSQKLDRRVAILADLPGLKIRVGEIKGGYVELQKGEKVVLTTRDVEGDGTTIPVEYKDFPRLVSKGDVIYLSDGYIILKVEEVREQEVEAVVISGGKLFSRKGINIPKAYLPVEAVTPRDMEIIKFAIEHNVDAVGLSFVGSVYDILKVKSFLEKRGASDVFVIAKIERPDAVRNFNEILNAADGIMIARGDLGVEMPIEQLPILQKKLIRRANLEGKPVITATQMLVSMTSERVPTRAEVTDVANAILDGTDAVMLSEETAIGKFPIEAVEMMAKIAKVTEEYRESLGIGRFREIMEEGIRGSIKEAITRSIIDALCTLNVKLILTPTKTGRTARLISRFKPKQWILAFSTNERVCNNLMFSYGVYSFCLEEGFDENDIIRLIKGLGLVESDDIVLMTEGKPIEKTVGTNSIKIFQIS
ncbi:pyruvate kinase [Pyrococcus sp. NA2]|uniref:pyruvate kinase n=1 Tax=Pyrococcus sp. (strain NA2) TaxID=342949 RepID=UPI000209ACC0|nr:pyruvate kinase [Pyrococcus sp. NA2]AEC52164.1 pyruvate kinase [Pyrococcus sp. NA2]